MLNIKNIFKISILSITIIQSIYAIDSKNDSSSKNLFYKKIDTHFLNLNCLTSEDCENINNHTNMSDTYNHEHEDKLKKDEYLKVESKTSTVKDSVFQRNFPNDDQPRTNKEMLNIKRKDRINKFRPLNPKSKASFPIGMGMSFGNSSFEVVPFHFEAPLSDK